MIMRRAIKVPIYPIPSQETLIQKTFGCTRFIWNQMLSDEQRFYNETGKHFIPTPASYKRQFPFLKEVDSLALANVQMNQNHAFSNFWKKHDKFNHPDFKARKNQKNRIQQIVYIKNLGKQSFLLKTASDSPNLVLSRQEYIVFQIIVGHSKARLSVKQNPGDISVHCFMNLKRLPQMKSCQQKKIRLD